MSLDSDKILDRRKLKRSRAVWRLFAVLAVVVLLIMVVGRFHGLGGQAHIASLEVTNIIVDNQERLKLLQKAADDPAIKALIVNINSPGGTVVGGESLYFALRDVSKQKPVVAVMREIATSAGYMIALGADHIVARQSTITGSIGVLMQSTDLTGFLDKLGIKPEVVKSSPLKAQPNPLEPFSDDARRAAQEIIADMQDMFVGLVKDRRELDDASLRKVSDGRIFTGRQALSNGLIDAIGGEVGAVTWLETEKNLPKNLPIVEMSVYEEGGILRAILEDLAGKTSFSERLRLDGLISLWHPLGN
ncbi:MAG: signal peptide peptidase SppA [Rhodospirillaceae bacterium TMED167]|nr:signal peptide peptidase SppA [Rhodospirillaceae bacterium]OUW30148.1 MAG: signal peptide peptidase SppA [Rhodospirillaceae bacterium TMED167]